MTPLIWTTLPIKKYSGISIKRTLYKADIILRRTVYLGTDGFRVKLLWKDLYKANNYKVDSRKTDTFYVAQMNFLPKNNLYKKGHRYENIFHVKRHLFSLKSYFLQCFTLFLNNIFHIVFCWLNCFGWSKKFKIYRNIKFVTSTMIHIFSSYINFYCIVRKC